MTSIFDSVDTENFEEILFALRQAEKICRQVGHDATPIRHRYRNIRRALIEAVRSVHPRHGQIPGTTLALIREGLTSYHYVYSTNYDLLAYWAIMTQHGQGFVDYFWNPNLEFDLTNTEVWGSVTKILYLHGGLHIYELPDGATAKATGAEGDDHWGTYLPLLDIGMSYQGADTPLFVTEGTWAHKLASIYRSAYLSFAYKTFADHKGPLVVFGQSLSDQDEHLTRAMLRWRDRPIAVSIRPG